MTTIYLCHCGEGYSNPEYRQEHIDYARHTSPKHWPSGQVQLSDDDALKIYNIQQRHDTP